MSKRHEEIFKKYSWDPEESDNEDIATLIEEIQDEYDMETPDGNYGHEDGGWMALILNIAESLTEDQHKELAEYFAATVKEVKWNE